MWFKNLRVYRFTQDFTFDASSLSEALEQGAFVPCGSQELARYGWVSPIDHQSDSDHGLVHASQEYLMICAKKQEKVLPAAVINEAVDEKAAAISEAEGRPVGRKERQSLKDDVLLELLPRAFARSSVHYAYIALKQGYIVINAASASKAEELLAALRDVVGSLPVIPLVSQQLPHQMMTQWVTQAEAPSRFTLGGECELADPKESGSVIRCKHQDLASAEINNLLQSGMIVTKLGLQWRQGIDFILDDQLAIKRLRFEDDIQDKANSHEAESKAELFDVEFAVMTVELTAFLADMVAALGGVNTQAPSVDGKIAQANKDDSSYTGVDEVVFE
ncbi:recombination-associated protein RdgC [Eionea flava]